MFEYANARAAVEDFFWNDFCDNYLEFIKKRAYNEDGSNDAGQQSAIHTVYHCLDGILKLFAPFVPHITEELYSHIFEEKHAQIGSIHARGTWSRAGDYPYDETAEQSGKDAVAILELVRKEKAEKNVSIKWPISRLSIATDYTQSIDLIRQDIADVTNSLTVDYADSGALKTDDARFAITVELAAESDAAVNRFL